MIHYHLLFLNDMISSQSFRLNAWNGNITARDTKLIQTKHLWSNRTFDYVQNPRSIQFVDMRRTNV